MKKITFLIGMFLVFFTVIKAQGPYVKVNLGGAFPLGSQTITNWTSTTSEEAKNLSFGQGMNFGVAVGTMLNKNIGVELGINYLMGFNTTTTWYQSNNTPITEKDKGADFSFIPAIIIESGMDNINPYARFGLVIGIPSFKTDQTDNSGGEALTKYSGGVALGFNAAMGVMFKLADKMSFFGELSMINLAYAPTKGVETDTYNGTSTTTTTTYTSPYSPPTSGNSNTDLLRKLPFGSWGINVGIKYAF